MEKKLTEECQGLKGKPAINQLSKFLAKEKELRERWKLKQELNQAPDKSSKKIQKLKVEDRLMNQGNITQRNIQHQRKLLDLNAI